MLPFFNAEKLHVVAWSRIGTPYKWGSKPEGGSPESFDCSGYVRWVYAQVGVVVPEGSYEQYLVTKPVLHTIQPGDVGFFMNADGTTKHVGLILDENTVIEARGHEPSLPLSNQVITRPRETWEGWREFSGWRRFAVLF